MMQRRSLFAVLLAAALVTFALAQQATGPTVRHNVNHGSVEMDGPFEVVQQVVDLAPGAQSPFHKHGGPELVLVTEGEMTLFLEEDGSETVYAAGKTFNLPADTFLQVRNDSDQKASFVVTFLLPEGATLTTPR